MKPNKYITTIITELHNIINDPAILPKGNFNGYLSDDLLNNRDPRMIKIRVLSQKYIKKYLAIEQLTEELKIAGFIAKCNLEVEDSITITTTKGHILLDDLYEMIL